MRHLWARKGTRPRIKRTAASNPVACPKYHLSAVHITDKSNADDIDELLAVIGAEVQEGLPLLSLTGQPGIGHMIWSALPMVLSCTCLPILGDYTLVSPTFPSHSSLP